MTVVPWLHHCKQGSPTYSEKEIMKPDFRNVTRGQQWMQSIVDALERMDKGEKDAMVKVLESMHLKRGRIVGEDDD